MVTLHNDSTGISNIAKINDIAEIGNVPQNWQHG